MSLTRRQLLAGAAGLAALRAGRTRADHDEAVRIVSVLPRTGVLALYGIQAGLGIDIAVESINEAGGIGGRRFDVTHIDNGSDTVRSAAILADVAADPSIMAAIGPIGSGARDAMLPAVERGRLPLLYATNYEGGACSRYVFSFGTVPNQDLGNLIPELTGTGDRRVFMLGSDYVWPRTMFRIARPLIELQGAEVVGEEYVPFGEPGFAHTIARIADRLTDVLLLAVPGDDGIAFMREAHRAGLLQRLTVGFLGFSEVHLDSFRDGESEGIRCSVPMVMTADEPEVRRFVQRIRRRKGPETVVSGYALTHFNAAMAVKAALERSGATDREALVDGLESLSFDTPTGPCFVDARDHHVTLPLYLAQVVDGRLMVTRKLDRVAPATQCG